MSKPPSFITDITKTCAITIITAIPVAITIYAIKGIFSITEYLYNKIEDKIRYEDEGESEDEDDDDEIDSDDEGYISK
jgi:hypothetical protein